MSFELAEKLKAELRHQAILTRLGRYPHRNIILGRVSTAKEKAFPDEPGSSFCSVPLCLSVTGMASLPLEMF